MIGALFGFAIGLLARLWVSTLRVSVSVHPSLAVRGDRPWVLALWHGQMMPLLAYRLRRRTVALVSLSNDGELLCSAFRVFGLSTERGSGSRGGASGRRAIVRRLRSDWDAAFAADGPRGPRHEAKPGALASARDANGVVVPFAAACSKAMVLRRSWDHFVVPLPFTRVGVVLGPALEPVPGVGERELTSAIEEGCRLARGVLRDVEERRTGRAREVAA